MKKQVPEIMWIWLRFFCQAAPPPKKKKQEKNKELIADRILVYTVYTP